MKKFFAFAAIAVVAGMLAGTADAASFKGVVVAKDAKRKALVTVSPDAVRTVRAAGRFARFHIGQRVAVIAAKRSDGTFLASAVRAAGRSQRVHFGAVIVKAESSRLIVSAGGSVFALRLRGTSTLGLRSGGLEPGDKVDVDADVKDGHIEAGSDNVDQTGHVESLVLEGIFLFPKDDGFDLAIVHRGLVHVSVPTGMVLPEFKAGDQIRVVVNVSAAGKFSFVKGQGEGHGKTEPPPSGAYAYGPLVEMSSISVGVKRENGEVLRCGIPAGLDLSIFSIGQQVKLYCALRDGHLAMKKMASDHGGVTGDGTGEVILEGALTEASADAAALSNEDHSFRCVNSAHLDLSVFVLGEHALMGCHLADNEWRLFKLKNERGYVYAGSDSSSELTAYGVVTERSTSLVIRREDGSTKACSVPAGMDLQGFRIGDRVKMHCHLSGSSFGLVEVYSENAFAKADGTGEFTTYGTVYYKNGDGIAVQREDHSIVTCGFPSGTNLDAFPVGTLVKIHCHRHDGSYRLAELQSETDHILARGGGGGGEAGPFLRGAGCSRFLWTEPNAPPGRISSKLSPIQGGTLSWAAGSPTANGVCSSSRTSARTSTRHRGRDRAHGLRRRHRAIHVARRPPRRRLDQSRGPSPYRPAWTIQGFRLGDRVKMAARHLVRASSFHPRAQSGVPITRKMPSRQIRRPQRRVHGVRNRLLPKRRRHRRPARGSLDRHVPRSGRHEPRRVRSRNASEDPLQPARRLVSARRASVGNRPHHSRALGGSSESEAGPCLRGAGFSRLRPVRVRT